VIGLIHTKVYKQPQMDKSFSQPTLYIGEQYEFCKLIYVIYSFYH